MTDEPTNEGSARCSVALWTTSKRVMWRVRVSDQADDELVDEVIARAVRAHHAVADKLAAGRVLFEGTGPTGDGGGT